MNGYLGPELDGVTLTEAEENSLAYLNYPSRPRLMDAHEAFSGGMLCYREPNCIYYPHEEDAEIFGASEIVIPPQNRYNLLGATLSGLNDALTRAEAGTTLRERFFEEYKGYTQLDEDSEREYGVYAYYPKTGHLVRYAPEQWHRLALVTSNSTLFLDQERMKKWEDVRALFDDLVVAIAGASVGSNVFNMVMKDICPRSIKIGDPNFYKVTNANRILGLTYADIVCSDAIQSNPLLAVCGPWGLNNKAIGAAEMMHKINPFVNIWAYYTGVDGDNIDSFIDGNRVEPATDVVVEETDNPDAKVEIRRKARLFRKYFLMGSDIGSTAQIDKIDFKGDPNHSLSVNATDDEVLACKLDTNLKPSQKSFQAFVSSLIGPEYLTDGEFGALMTGDLPKTTASMPQLASTASVVAGILADMIARNSLGHTHPSRVRFSKKDFSITTAD